MAKVDDLDEVHSLASSESTPDQNLENEQRIIYVNKAISMLQPIDATIISLFYLKQMNLDEIGKIVGLKSNAVKVKLHRARKRLATELGKVLNHEAEFL